MLKKITGHTLAKSLLKPVGINKWTMILLAMSLLLVGTVIVVATHASSGDASTSYVHPFARINNFSVSNSCGANAQPGIIAQWDRPSYYAQIDYYQIYKNGKVAGTFTTGGLQTPQRTSTCFFGTFKSGDNIEIQAFADSAKSSAKLP